MTDKNEEFEKLKSELIRLLGTVQPADIQRSEHAIIAAVMLSEGMDLTFDVFDDKHEAIEAIMSALTRVGKRHGVQFTAESSLHPLH